MSRKRRKFTLVEAMVAIIIATLACLFLLDFEKSYINQAKRSLQKLQKEHMMQEATVRLLEELYTCKIDWKAFLNQSSVTINLSDPHYQLNVKFDLVNHGQEILPNLLDLIATLTIVHNEVELEPTSKLRLCLKREERLNVQAPKA